MAMFSKQDIARIVSVDDRGELLALFDQDPDRVRRYLVRLAYDPDAPIHRNAIDCLRFLARERADDMRDFFFETIRRQLWSMNEEGGNNAWSAPEICGAVIAGAPNLYGKYFSFAYCAAIDELTFQPSLVRAYDMVASNGVSEAAEFKESIDSLRKKLENGDQPHAE